MAIVLVSILVHELGHAFVLRAYQQRPHVVLYAFGGLTYGSSPNRSRSESIVVSLAGPLSALLLLGLPAYLLSDGSWALQSYDRYVIVHDIAWVNIVWSVLNLMPVLPLDGGNIAATLFGQRPARILSVIVAGGGVVYFLETGNPVRRDVRRPVRHHQLRGTEPGPTTGAAHGLASTAGSHCRGGFTTDIG